VSRLGNVSVGGSNPVRIMGIINLSPESFFKKSVKTSENDISNIVSTMEQQGADFFKKDSGLKLIIPIILTGFEPPTDTFPNRLT